MNPQDLRTQQASGVAPIFYSPGEVMADAPAQSPTQTNLPSKGNWFERNAQTIGGILGGIGGEILDPFGGGVAGAALGSGLGQEVKNKTTGTTTNPLEEAVIGGASEFGGQLLGKAGHAVLGKAGELADRYGVNLLSQVGGTVDRRTARALGAEGTTRFMSDLGINPAEHATVSKGVIDTLTPLVNKGVGQAGNVDTNGLKDMVDSLINNETGLGGMANEKGTEAYKLSQTLKSQIDKLGGMADENGAPLLGTSPPRDILAPNANPSDTLDTIKTLQKQAAELTGKGKNPLTITDRARAEASIRRQIASELEDRLYQGAGANDVVAKGLVDEKAIAALEKTLPDTPAAKEFIAGIKNAESIKELRSAQAPFVNAAQLAAEKEAGRATEGASRSTILKQGIGAAGVMAAPFTGGASALLPAAELALGTDTGKTIVGNTLRKVPQILEKYMGTGTSDIVGNLSGKDIASQVATQTAAAPFTGMPSMPPATPGGPGGPSTPGSVASLISSSVDNTMAPLNARKNGTPANMPSLADLLQAGGTNGLDAYLAYQRQESPQLSEQQQKDWMDAQNAMNDIKQFASVYEKAAAKGAGAGQLEMLGAKIPGIQNLGSESAIKAYEDNKGDLASSLATILGGGKNSKAMLTELKSELPDITDSPQAAAMKMHLIVQRLGQHMNTILAAPATNTPGQLANFAGQTVPGTIDFSTPQSAMGF